MTTLRMNTERVRIAAQQIERAVEQLYMKPSKLKGLSGAVNSAWDGGRSNYYVSQLRQLGNELQKEVIKLQKLAQRTRQEVDEWEDGDRFESSNLFFLHNDSIGNSIGSFSDEASSYGYFNLLAWSGGIALGVGDSAKNVLDIAENIGKLGQSFPLSSYSQFGRTLNSLVGNKHAGYVGKMDQLGHLVKGVDKNTLEEIGDAARVLSFGLGVVEDLGDGDNLIHAVSSEALEAGMNYGIRAAAYTIPIAGQAMMIYDASMAAGRLVATGMDLVGLDSEAAWLNNSLDFIDIGEYTDKIADGITDFIGNTAKNTWNWLLN